MHLSPSSRPTRARRLLAVSAAAVAVMIAPTACDYGGYGNGSSANDTSGDMGNMPGMDHGARTPDQQPVVVPVAQTRDAAAADGERRNRWRNRPAGNTPTTTTTTAAPATTTPADPAATGTTSATAAPVTDPAAPVAGAAGTVAAGGRDGKNNGLDILGRDCSKSKLTPHNGFQSVDAQGADVGAGGGVATCVSTQMGEVAAEDELPSLLIVDSPRFVGMNQAFTLKVSTRNLVRDRFLGAAKGGYYLESSFLNGAGLQRGHFHTACRILETTKLAPNSGVAPAFFLATEDGGGGKNADVVTIPVPAIGKPGILQCTSWAGDGSHRTPMMTRANETPAIDSVRIFVTRRNQPVRYDAAAANADSGKNVAAQQAPGQSADLKAAAPAAPNAAGTPNTPVDESGNPVDPNVAAGPGDTAPPVADAAPAGDAAVPTGAEDPAGN